MTNKQLIFKSAWNEHKIKLKHNCLSSFGDCLKKSFRIARMVKISTNGSGA